MHVYTCVMFPVWEMRTHLFFSLMRSARLEIPSKACHQVRYDDMLYGHEQILKVMKADLKSVYLADIIIIRMVFLRNFLQLFQKEHITAIAHDEKQQHIRMHIHTYIHTYVHTYEHTHTSGSLPRNSLNRSNSQRIVSRTTTTCTRTESLPTQLRISTMRISTCQTILRHTYPNHTHTHCLRRRRMFR